MPAEMLLDYERRGDSQVRELQLVRVNNEHFAVYLVGGCEIKREFVGFPISTARSTYEALKREWKKQCQPP